MVPEWAPNVHPLVVHFPIALLVVAVLADFLALVGRRYKWLSPAATGLFILGAIAAWVAFLSGREAAEGVLLPAAANPVLTEHADWAQRTVWFFSILALARFAVTWQGWMRQVVVHLGFFLIGAGGLFMLYETGDHGAQLVYQHGVGVLAADQSQMNAHDHAQHHIEGETLSAHESPAEQEPHEMPETEEDSGHGHEDREISEIDFQVEENGAWTWDTGRGSGQILAQHFEWLTGTWDTLNPQVVHDAAKGEVLALTPKGTSAIFVTGIPLGSMQGDLGLNLDGFTGKVMIVHHVQDSRNYNFLALGNGQVSLGEVREGAEKVHDKDNVSAKGWLAVRVVSDKTHFRGYINDKMVVHGHGKEPSPGRVGLLVEGTGSLLLDDLKVTVLR